MSIWKFVFLSIMVLPQSKPSPQTTKLIGAWQGQYKQIFISPDSGLKSLQMKIIPRIALVFKKHFNCQIIYLDSIDTIPPSTLNFRYRYKNNILALVMNGYVSRYTVELTKSNKLHLSTYPAPRGSQEDVEILTLIDFYKKPAK
jgi:hypothetical protein